MAERTNNRSDLRIVKDVNGKMVLFVKERQTKARPREISLLSCLADKMGRVVSYEVLCPSLGFTSAPKSKRLLRQHVTNLRKILSEHRANSAVVVAVGFGYGLSEMASPPNRWRAKRPGPVFSVIDCTLLDELSRQLVRRRK